MSDHLEPLDDYENDDDLENEVDEELEDGEVDDDIERQPLLTEIISVWISAISLIFKPKAITFEEEIDFASWRRIGVTLVSGILIATVGLELDSLYINQQLHLPIQNYRIPFDIFWAVLVGFVVFSFIIWLGSYISYHWIIRQKIATESNVLEHSQITAVVWLSKQILLFLWSLLTIPITALFSQISGSLDPQFGVDNAIILGGTIGLVVGGIIILYTLWILSRGMRVNHEGLRGGQLWIVIGINFIAQDPLRILISNILPKIPLVISLHNQLQKILLRQA